MEQVRHKIVTKIEANPLLSNNSKIPKRLRVAAYCRVSTDEDEQLNSYEAQIAYYTEAIAKNPMWSLAGIYADEGISGTGTKKRHNFMRMMSDCEKGKIDFILTKSISRFARNTVDSLSYVRKLRAMNIGVYFEEQALDSLKVENEMLIGLFSVIAQAESENISGNVKWGIRESMKNGNFYSNFKCFGYDRGEDGIPKIVPEEAEVVRFIFNRYLDGLSLEQIQLALSEKKIKSPKGNELWDRGRIKSILECEKYVGDLLLQKTYISDPISKKTKKNHGELPKYLISNNHPAIIERDCFNRVQTEFARRRNAHKKSTRSKTELGKYSGKYVLSEILICGECGSHYKRTGKTKKDGSRLNYWRCINRIENGKESCNAIGIEETKLQNAICDCINNVFKNEGSVTDLLKSSIKFALTKNESSDNIFIIENQIHLINQQIDNTIDLMDKTGGDSEKYIDELNRLSDDLKILREKLEIAKAVTPDENEQAELERIYNEFAMENSDFTVFDQVSIRKMIEYIRVMQDGRLIIIFKGGIEAETKI